jgi:ATP synthase protein I
VHLQQLKSEAFSRPLPRAIFGIIGIQAGTTVLAALVALWVAGALAAKSAVLGGVIGIVPGTTYGLIVLGRKFGPPRAVLSRHYIGEFSKLVITLLLFGAVFAWVRELSALPLFAAYFLTLLAYWAALLVFR